MVTLEMYDVAGEYVGQCEGQLTLQYENTYTNQNPKFLQK